MKETCPRCGRAKTSWGWLVVYVLGVGSGAVITWMYCYAHFVVDRVLQ